MFWIDYHMVHYHFANESMSYLFNTVYTERMQHRETDNKKANGSSIIFFFRCLLACLFCLYNIGKLHNFTKRAHYFIVAVAFRTQCILFVTSAGAEQPQTLWAPCAHLFSVYFLFGLDCWPALIERMHRVHNIFYRERERKKTVLLVGVGVNYAHKHTMAN